MLGELLRVMNGVVVIPKVSIDYTIKDAEPVKNELLAKAVADSKHKAELMSQAAGVELGDVKSIDYSWGEICVTNHYDVDCDMIVRECKDDITPEFTPKDIDLTDTVTV